MNKKIMKAILAGTFACLGVAACTTQTPQEPIKPVIVSKIKPVNTLSKEFSIKMDNGSLITTNREYVYQEKDNMKTLYKVRSSEYSNNVRRLTAKEVVGNKTLNIEVVDYTFEQGWKTTVKVNGETMEGVAVNEVKTVNYKQIEEDIFSSQKFTEDEPSVSTTETKSVKTETIKTKPTTKKQEVRNNKFNKELAKESKETTKQPESNKNVIDSAKEKAVEVKDKVVDSMKEKTESIVKTVEEKAVKAVEKVENSTEEIKK